jgi:hypothetical protein
MAAVAKCLGRPGPGGGDRAKNARADSGFLDCGEAASEVAAPQRGGLV